MHYLHKLHVSKYQTAYTVQAPSRLKYHVHGVTQHGPIHSLQQTALCLIACRSEIMFKEGNCFGSASKGVRISEEIRNWSGLEPNRI